VIRRKARDIERFAGVDLFLREIDRRGYRAIENSGQIVIFCNRAPIRWLTPGAPRFLQKKSDEARLSDRSRPVNPLPAPQTPPTQYRQDTDAMPTAKIA